MNKSKSINPRICRTCAKCCRWFSIGYPKTLMKNDPALFSEIQRYLELDTDKIFVIEYKNEFSVIFDFPCVNLKKNKGMYYCKIYTKDRPLLCETYPHESESCEKYIREINIFRNSDEFLKRVKEII